LNFKFSSFTNKLSLFMEEIRKEWVDVVAHQPNFVKVKPSSLGGKGAFSRKKIKAGTFLGHYMGHLGKKDHSGPYVFHTTRESETVSIDAGDPKYSNWTRYMNCSVSHESENVTSYFLTNTTPVCISTHPQPISLEGYIVFYANRDIKVGEELLYYYGDYYANLLSIDYNKTKT